MNTYIEVDTNADTSMNADTNKTTRRQTPRTMLAICQDEMVMKDRITAILRDGPKTIIEISRALDYPTHEVIVWLMALRRYGRVEEVGRADVDGYFSYQLTEKATESAD